MKLQKARDLIINPKNNLVLASVREANILETCLNEEKSCTIIVYLAKLNLSRRKYFSKPNKSFQNAFK